MLYYSYGSALITEDEVHELNVKPKVNEFLRGVAAKSLSLAKRIDLPNGELTADMVSRGFNALAKGGAPTPWSPIGLGQPLTLDVREVYTGKHPGSGIFGGAKPMLLTSAVKSIATYDATPRAINFLSRQVKAGSRMTRPAATAEGTPVLYYSPALTERSLTLDLSIVFDNFPEEFFAAVGNAFKSAAGMPVFLSHSLHLFAAGEVARLAGVIGEKLFDGKPVLETSTAINVLLPGEIPTVAGSMLITPSDVDRIDPAFRSNYSLVEGSLVDKNGAPYTGDIPYIVIAVDGTERPDLKDFAPTAASSAVVSRFFGIKEGQSAPLAPLIDALKLYNDFSFRSKIDEIDRQLPSMQDGPDKSALQDKRAALLKNIMTDALKPPA